ncbi:hypothetical protein, partial [uncultured Hyphomonas sp.]|uniref:hypothetical protein n=1 Tax=uncultured Hyphomonas sp. TaxID=225298 RepID=UPI0030D9C115
MVTSFLLFPFFLGILAQNTSRQQSNRSACLFYDVLCDYESERLGLWHLHPINRALTSALALGIKMGEPLFKIRDLLRRHRVKALSSSYTLYGDL